MVTGPLDTPGGTDRLAGYRDVLVEAGLPYDPALVAEGDYRRAGGERAARRLLARAPDMDAVFVASDLMAQGVVSVLQQSGRSVPGDIAVGGFDDSPGGHRHHPGPHHHAPALRPHQRRDGPHAPRPDRGRGHGRGDPSDGTGGPGLGVSAPTVVTGTDVGTGAAVNACESSSRPVRVESVGRSDPYSLIMAASTAYSLVATDLDGTLLRGDDTALRPVARRARAGGGGRARHLVVTGRPAPRVRPLLDDLGSTGLAVCGQGAQVYDAGADRLLWSVTLDRELAETALGKIEAEVGQVYAAVDQDGVDGLTLIEPGYLMPHPTLPAVRVGRRDDLWCEPISKVLLRHPDLSDDELAATARSVVGSLATVTMSGPGTVELQPCGITKATGLALAAEHLGLRPAGHDRLRGHAQRHPHVRLGGPRRRDGQRPPRTQGRGRRGDPRRTRTTASPSSSNDCFARRSS